MSSLPETMKALVLKSTSEPPSVETIPVPHATPGSAVVRVLAANVISYMRDIYDGTRPYPMSFPLVPGSGAIGRVAAVATDATKLKAGDLVVLDGFIRSRDEPADAFLPGFHQGGTEGSAKLMREVWRNWTFAEYCRTPLESLTLLNEHRLCKELGYRIPEIAQFAHMTVAYGGFTTIGLKAGQTVIVSPATGPFGGAAVHLALAMGAFVIAMGRNEAALEQLKHSVSAPQRLATVPITGDVRTDLIELKKHGEADAFFDISPPAAVKSTHFRSAILALRHGGKISLMSGYHEDVPIPATVIVHRNLTLYGKWMYDRSDIADVVSMIETGVIRLGKESGMEIVGEYPLEEYKKAWDVAAEHNKPGKFVMICP